MKRPRYSEKVAKVLESNLNLVPELNNKNLEGFGLFINNIVMTFVLAGDFSNKSESIAFNLIDFSFNIRYYN